MPAGREVLARAVEQFRGKRARPDPCGVGLGNPQHVIQVERPEAAARRGTAGRGIGRGDEGIGAVIDIQQRTLGSLEENVRSPKTVLMEERGDVGNHRPELFDHGEGLIQRGPKIHRVHAVVARKLEIVEIHNRLELGSEALGIE